jgi:hypothetical protein
MGGKRVGSGGPGGGGGRGGGGGGKEGGGGEVRWREGREGAEAARREEERAVGVAETLKE